MRRFLRRLGIDITAWSGSLLLLAAAGFLERFGMGVTDSARTNFFVDTLGMTGNQVLWLEGIREIPGLILMFIAALMMQLPLSRRAALSVFIMGLGYTLYATVGAYPAILGISLIDSFGVHMWMPLQPSLAMSLSTKATAGRIMGTLNAVGSLAAIVGMGALALVSRFSSGIPLKAYYVIGGCIVILASLLLFRIPTAIGATEAKPPRMLIKRRYWLYYILTFLGGADKQALNTFGLLVLVNNYGLEVWQISTLLVVSSVINMIGTPYLGRLLDRLGERTTMTANYVVLTLCCVGFATIHNVGVLIALILIIKLLMTMGMGLSTYVYRIAPPEELTPTLSAGISINHVTSVGMPLLSGLLLPIVGYNGIFWMTAVVLLLAIPFALMLQVSAASAVSTQVQPAAAK